MIKPDVMDGKVPNQTGVYLCKKNEHIGKDSFRWEIVRVSKQYDAQNNEIGLRAEKPTPSVYIDEKYFDNYTWSERIGNPNVN